MEGRTGSRRADVLLVSVGPLLCSLAGPETQPRQATSASVASRGGALTRPSDSHHQFPVFSIPGAGLTSSVTRILCSPHFALLLVWPDLAKRDDVFPFPPFNQDRFIQYLVSAKLHSRHWRNHSRQDRHEPRTHRCHEGTGVQGAGGARGWGAYSDFSGVTSASNSKEHVSDYEEQFLSSSCPLPLL